VYVGARATLRDVESGAEVLYTLVGQEEANPMEGLISITSPIAKALLGHGIGETIEIKVPRGVIKYTITAITRE